MDNLKNYFKEEINKTISKYDNYNSRMWYYLPIDGEPVIVGKLNYVLEDDQLNTNFVSENEKYYIKVDDDSLSTLYLINKVLNNMSSYKSCNFQIQKLIIAIQDYARNIGWKGDYIPSAEDIAYEMDWNMEIINAIYLKGKFYQYRVYMDKDMNSNIQITGEIPNPLYWRYAPPKSQENLYTLESMVTCKDLTSIGLYYTYLHKIEKKEND